MPTEKDEITELLKELILINGIIATEIITLVENSSKIARKSDTIPPNCATAHKSLNEQILKIIEKYHGDQASILRDHITKH
ncbi:MAG: hypothetical protein ACTSRW_12460 [Candidatus Helarchaeota archaeon]